ncbi:hypothetical protein, partial [Pandoraea sputorum]|uniref:hypothetical protein n=1 Tax=Pandoraea sputorum TaxID=93222 RepID=UPI00355817C1
TTNSGGNGLRMAVSADGASVYMGGYVYATGLGQVSISNDISLDYLEDSTITLAIGLPLGAREYDALNGGAGNYKDAVIRLERAAGANANDSFGFTAGNNLTLENAEIRLNNAVIATFNDSNGTLLL